MALVIESFQTQNAADLQSQINTYLAGLTSPIIRGVWITATEDARTLGRTYRALVTTETGGSAADPWVISIFEGQNASDVGDAAAAVIAGAPGDFFNAPRIDSWYFDGGSLTARCFAWILENADAVNAAADYLPL